MAYNTYQSTGLEFIRAHHAPSIEESQWESLNRVFGEALLDVSISSMLLKGDFSLLISHGIDGRIQTFIQNLKIQSLDELARRLILEFGS